MKALLALGVTGMILLAIWVVETLVDHFRPRTPAWARIMLMFGVGVLVFMLALKAAGAHDHAQPELTPWMKGLHAKDGAWCCNGDDTDAVEDWETKGDRYRVKFRGEWFDVPEGAIVDGINRNGQVLLWMNKGYLGVSVRCFMAGPLI